MALRGTLGDFALTDILQLIGLQRKTGILVLRRDGEQVTMTFEDGSVVGADSVARPLEQRVGQLLARTGKVTEQRLEEALQIQRRTLRPLGRVLLDREWIDRTTLCRFLRLQVTETVYTLFRWQDGEYDFQPEESVEWDRELFSPIPADNLLMEGAQMVDEWPIIERLIPSPDIVLRLTAAAREALATRDLDEAQGSIYDRDLDFGFLPENPLEDAEAGPRLGEREMQVLRWVDGERTVDDVVALSAMGSFEGYKTLAQLLEAGLVERVDLGTGRARRAPSLMRAALPGRALVALVAGLAILGGLLAAQELWRAFVPGPRVLPAEPMLASAEGLGRITGLDRLRETVSAARMARIENAAKVFYLDAGRWPASLTELVNRELLPETDVRDPWGERYVFELDGAELRIAESLPHGGRRPNQRIYELSAVERAAR
jgi:hypothetical protein